jgi:outer membrane protein assembly factor BamB
MSNAIPGRLAAAVFLLLAASPAGRCQEWSRFRGPNGSGVLEAGPLPVKFGPDSGVVWKTALPPGHSSPVVAGKRLFVTGYEDEQLLTLALDQDTGKVLWTRKLPRARKQRHNKDNNPASPTPATDGRDVFVFFGDFGLAAYSVAGEERWRLPLGPFANAQGMAGSPILVSDSVVMLCDQDRGSYLLLVDKRTGRIREKIDRASVSYGTPIVVDGDVPQVVVSGTGQLVGYAAPNAERLWWVGGLPYQPKASPILVRTAAGKSLVVSNAQSIENIEKLLPPFPKMLADSDKNGDGRISRDETPEAVRGGFDQVDFDGDGYFTAEEHAQCHEMAKVPHTLLAVGPDGRGDLTGKVAWRHARSLPNVSTPICYKDILFLVRDGGVVTSMNPETGEVYKQARLEGALAKYFSSPVASGGRIYMASTEGHVSVLKAERGWEILAVNNLGEPIFATPAIADGRLYIRTSSALYCFAAGRDR